ncbi:MAG: hypothetical protein V3T48_10550, partial [Vicinamibacterales bacterium]
LTLASTITARGDWTYVQGTVAPGTSTVVFARDGTTISGSHSLGNARFSPTAAASTYTIASGTIVTVTGQLELAGTNQLTLDTGDIHAEGDVLITNTHTGSGGTATLTFSRSASQTVTGPGTPGQGGLPFVIVDKTGGAVTLAGDVTVAQSITLTSGELTHDIAAANSLTVNGSGGTAVSIAAAGTWSNPSPFTSTIKLGADVANAGSVSFVPSGCDAVDTILIRSTVAGTQRAWTGAGSFVLANVDVKDQAGSAAINVLNGNDSGNNGANWSFGAPGCSGGVVCWDGGGSTNNWSEAANWTFDAVPLSTDSALFNATCTKDASFDVADTIAGLTIDSGYTGSITYAADMTNNGTYVQNAGVVNLGTSTLTQKGSWTYGGGTAPTTGTVVFDDTSLSISGSHTLGDVTFTASGTSKTFTIAGGTTLTIGGTLTLAGSAGVLLATGDIHAQGHVTVTNSSTQGGGNATLTLNGSGAQTLTGSGTVGQGLLPIVIIDKAAGTLTLASILSTQDDWMYMQGAIASGSSTVAFVDTLAISGSHTLGKISFDSGSGTNTFTIAGGTTLTAADTLTLSGAGAIVLDTGTLAAKGDVTITNTSTAGGGSATLSLEGAADQTLSGPGTSGQGELPSVVVNKTTGGVSIVGNVAVEDSLTITSGTLRHDTTSANSLRVLGAGTAVSVAADGAWTNNSTATSTITLAGGISNSGSIDFDATEDNCGDPDVVLVRSSVAGTQRSWSGAGSFSMVDVDVKDQAGSASITVEKGTDSGNNGANWVFEATCSGAPPPPPVEPVNSSSDSTSGSTLTWTHVVGSGSDRLLVVGVDMYTNGDNVTVTSVTLDPSAPSCSASPTTYTTVGTPQYTVPADCDTVTVEVWGAGGGGATGD